MAEQVDIARALKDKKYFESLGPAERDLVPENPVGQVTLTDEDLDQVAGGNPEQTGTGAPQCECQVTVTADSNGGTCYCTCKAT